MTLMMVVVYGGSRRNSRKSGGSSNSSGGGEGERGDYGGEVRNRVEKKRGRSA